MVCRRSTGNVPSGRPIASPVPIRPIAAVTAAGPQPPIHTARATAPINVAYGASGPTSGTSNQRRATATAAMPTALAYLTRPDMGHRVDKGLELGKVIGQEPTLLPPTGFEKRSANARHLRMIDRRSLL